MFWNTKPVINPNTIYKFCEIKQSWQGYLWCFFVCFFDLSTLSVVGGKTEASELQCASFWSNNRTRWVERKHEIRHCKGDFDCVPITKQKLWCVIVPLYSKSGSEMWASFSLWHCKGWQVLIFPGYITIISLLSANWHQTHSKHIHLPHLKTHKVKVFVDCSKHFPAVHIQFLEHLP